MVQSSTKSLRIGTRGSPLALVQAEAVRAALAAAHGIDAASMEIRIFRTSGDRIQDRLLADAGGKGLFTKEIEEALLSGEIDLAVHSAKDMPTFLPDGLLLAACLKREDPRDAFISRKAASIAALPQGASVGTSSPRRKALVKGIRPDLTTPLLRGNVETRLRKLEAGDADATILAFAGLKRLGLADVATRVMEIDEFLPAAGQGAIAIEIRADDARIRAMTDSISHADTFHALTAERAFLSILDGSCRTPIAAHATISGNVLRLRGQIASPDGDQSHDIAREGLISDAAAIGEAAGHEMKRLTGTHFFQDT
jgi:hydroxymethylbilane synthase